MTQQFTSIIVIVLGLLCSLTSAEESKNQVKSAGLTQLTAADTPLCKGDTIAFFGDSVTMQGGFIKHIDDALKQSGHTKDLGIKIFKHGLNGGRVPTVLEGKSPWGDLGDTMASLLEKEHPTVVVIYLGINDVWHGEKGTTKPDFEAGLKEMTAMSNKVGAAIVLCTPTIIGEETQDNKLNDKLGEYSDIVRKIAADEKLTLCDLHEAFLDELKRVNPENRHKGNLTYDGVHMNENGNSLLTDQISLSIAKTVKVRSAPK